MQYQGFGGICPAMIVICMNRNVSLRRTKKHHKALFTQQSMQENIVFMIVHLGNWPTYHFWEIIAVDGFHRLTLEGAAESVFEAVRQAEPMGYCTTARLWLRNRIYKQLGLEQD